MPLQSGADAFSVHDVGWQHDAGTQSLSVLQTAVSSEHPEIPLTKIIDSNNKPINILMIQLREIRIKRFLV